MGDKAWEVRCPECDGPVQIWTDNSVGVTINFACDNDGCTSGKEPWDTPRPKEQAS